MSRYRVTVIDGPLPPRVWEAANMEPRLDTNPADESVRAELMRREPLFHRPEFGISRKDFDNMLAPGFWEVGASGRRYSREFVLDVLEKRYEKPAETVWEMEDFHCFEVGARNYVATYTLFQGERVTRRSTIWRRTQDGWQAVFHQGTVVAKE